MNLLNSISNVARSDPDRLAFSCHQRQTSYRKLASRIERATARLQGEWNVRPGETVAYTGEGHQDAVVLLLALAQSGASLLVAQESHSMLPMLLREYGVRTLLNDAGVSSILRRPPPFVRMEALHAIIAKHCPFPAIPLASGERLSRLVRVPEVDAGPGCEPVAVTDVATLFMSACQPAEAGTLHEENGANPAREAAKMAEVRADRLFDENMLGPVVLSALAEGRSLRIL